MRYFNINSIRIKGIAVAIALFFSVNVFAQNTFVWSGGHSSQPTNWDLNANWVGTSKPGPTDHVIIPAVTTAYPFIDDNITAASIIIQSGAAVNIATSGNFTVTGNFTNYGTVTNNGNILVTGTLLFQGSAFQTFNGTGEAEITTMTVDNSFGVSTSNVINVVSQLNLINGKVHTTSTGIIRMNPSALISGASPERFISGRLAHTFTSVTQTEKFYPIGKDTMYRPLTLDIALTNSSPTKIIAEQIQSAPAPRNFAPGSGLVAVSTVRHYHITKSSGSPDIASGTVKITYQNDDGAYNPADLRIAYSPSVSSDWQNIGGTGTASGSGSITSANSFNLGHFVLATTNFSGNPLPVELISFTAEAKEKSVDLNWATASELNNSHFEIERSTNGIEWNNIGFENGNGNITSRVNYKFTDENPANGINYYRLKQVDFDGSFEYSDMVAVKISTPLVITISENPVVSSNTKIYIDGLSATNNNVSVSVINMTGQVMTNLFTASSPVVDLNIDHLTSGNYILQVTTDNEVITQRFIIRR